MIFSAAKLALEKFPDYLPTLAMLAEPSVLAQKAELYEAAYREWKNDVEKYSFNCKRFADFLTLTIERGANSNDKESYHPHKFATTVNIGAATKIELLKGHEPDLKGEILYGVSKYIVDPRYGDTTSYGGGVGGGGGGSDLPATFVGSADKIDGAVELQYEGHDKKIATAWFKVAPTNLPQIPTNGRAVFHIYEPPIVYPSNGVNTSYLTYGGGGGSYYYGRTADYKTKDFPRIAEDDQIEFGGIKATIYVPAGLGQHVYDKILKEIGSKKK